MNKNRHLTQEERIIIETWIQRNESFKSIGRELGKDPTTISKEVKNHIQFKKTGAYGKCFNDCLIRKDCSARRLCGKQRCNRACSFCRSNNCSSLCSDYRKEICHRLSKPPYVCNGCELRRSCTLEKRLYSANLAQKEYEADITLMMNHINSYTRLNLGQKAPYEVFASLYGEEPLRRMGAELIPAEEVTLRPYLLKK